MLKQNLTILPKDAKPMKIKIKKKKKKDKDKDKNPENSNSNSNDKAKDPSKQSDIPGTHKTSDKKNNSLGLSLSFKAQQKREKAERLQREKIEEEQKSQQNELEIMRALRRASREEKNRLERIEHERKKIAEAERIKDLRLKKEREAREEHARKLKLLEIKEEEEEEANLSSRRSSIDSSISSCSTQQSSTKVSRKIFRVNSFSGKNLRKNSVDSNSSNGSQYNNSICSASSREISNLYTKEQKCVYIPSFTTRPTQTSQALLEMELTNLKISKKAAAYDESEMNRIDILEDRIQDLTEKYEDLNLKYLELAEKYNDMVENASLAAMYGGQQPHDVVDMGPRRSRPCGSNPYSDRSMR